jgi:hypothetical protein
MNVKVLTIGVALGIFGIGAPAATISGSFNLNGIVTVTATTIDWNSDQPPPVGTPEMFTMTQGTGAFATTFGQETIHNLNSAAEPVNTVFPPVDFIDFPTNPALPSLLINFVAGGNGGTTGCTQPPAATTPPQTCTLPNPPIGSPFTFQNNSVNGQVTGSSATWTFNGVTSDGLETWSGIFTSQFIGQSYQQVLAAFGPGGSGSVQASYSGTIIVAPIPEPGTALLIGLGLCVFSLILKVRRVA